MYFPDLLNVTKGEDVHEASDFGEHAVIFANPFARTVPAGQYLVVSYGPIRTKGLTRENSLHSTMPLASPRT
jgi:hypothetical protein